MLGVINSQGQSKMIIKDIKTIDGGQAGAVALCHSGGAP